MPPTVPPSPQVTNRHLYNDREFTLNGGGCVIERHEAEAFLTLAEELHFGRTAERLHVSTARVSQTIRKLERTVGVPLFHRTSRRTELTLTGRQLRDELRPAWDGVETAVRHAIDTGRGLPGALDVAFISAAGAQLLSRAAAGLRDRVPGCEVRIREARPRELLPWLCSGEVDLALSTLPFDDPRVTCGPVLVREACMLAVAADHPFARREAITTADLGRVSLAGLADDPREGPTTVSEALALAGSGHGALLVGAHARRYYARPDVVYLPVSDALPLEWGLIWAADRETARVRAFAEVADSMVH